MKAEKLEVFFRQLNRRYTDLILSFPACSTSTSSFDVKGNDRDQKEFHPVHPARQ